MKLIACGLVIVLCSIVGYMQACKIDERNIAIGCILDDIRKLSMQLEFTSEPIGIIIDKIRMSSELSNLWDDMQRNINSGMSCKEAWERVMMQEKSPLYMLQDAEKERLDVFFDTLGRFNIDSEKKNAEIAYMTLEEIKERIENDTASKKKIYKSLGTLVGIALAILLI